MSFLQAFLGFNKIKRTLYMLSFLWLLLISSITCVSCFDVSVSPGSICCGDWVTVTISLTNNGDSVFSGRLEIYIIDANGYQDRMDGLSITLQPHESRTFQTRIRPKDCKSYGTYQVVVKLIDNNGRDQGTRTSSFVVKNPTSCQLPPECTWTFTCDNNIVKRLCIDQSGKEYWKEYDDCNKYNPPRKCINGVCVDVDIPPTCNQQTCPPPSQCIDGRCEPPCDQQACQNQNRPIGTPYTKNGLQYQKYMECGCVNHQCKCVEVEKPNQKQPSCDSCQSGPIGKPYLKDGRAYQKYQECTCVDGKCNCKSVEKVVPCEGTISGYVFDAKNPILPEATLLICDDGGNCISTHSQTSPSSFGFYNTDHVLCPSTAYEITCSADGYKAITENVITDVNGDAFKNFALDSAVKLVSCEFTDDMPIEYKPLLDYIGKNIAIRGRVDAVLEPVEKINYLKVDVKLGFIRAKHCSIFSDTWKNLNPGIDYETGADIIPAYLKQHVEWETKTFDMTSKDHCYSANVEVKSTEYGNIFVDLISILTSGGVALIEKLNPFMPDVDTYITGDEPIYIYAEITKIWGTDTSGNELEFPIVNKKIKTTYHKQYLQRNDEATKEIEQLMKDGKIF